VFRTRVHGLLSWAVDSGLIPANVLAGARRRRGTRAQMLEAETATKGRMLDMGEIAALWAATLDPKASRSFGAYVRMLLVAGARRTELAAARLAWISAGGADQPPVLMLPPEITKNGRAHPIPLPALAQGIIAGVARFHSSDLLFPGGVSRRNGKIVAISGWSKLWPTLLKIASTYGVVGRLTLHDLRKSARSHWARLGIPTEVCEAMLNHRPRSRLVAIYDLNDRLDQRIDAMTRWCAALEQAVAARDGAKVGKGAEIVALLSSRRSASLKKYHPKRVIRQVSDA
jgi:integrase